MPGGKELGGQQSRLPPVSARGSNRSALTPLSALPSPPWTAPPKPVVVPEDAEKPIKIMVRRRKQAVGSLEVETQPLEVEILPSQTVADLKRAVFELGGVPVEEQRLFLRSCRLDDYRKLNECHLPATRAEVFLVPTLRHRAAGGVGAIPARRGFNMVPGSSPWAPSRHTILKAQDLRELFGAGAAPDDAPNPLATGKLVQGGYFGASQVFTLPPSRRQGAADLATADASLAAAVAAEAEFLGGTR